MAPISDRSAHVIRPQPSDPAQGRRFSAHPRRGQGSLPRRRIRAGRRARGQGTKLGYIALTDAAPLIIAKEKGFFTKHGLPDMDIAKQASWGATRDNMALGLARNGIDGGHILRPKAHLYSTGSVMQNNQPLPMYTLLNLNEDCQGISVAKEYADLKIGKDSSPLKAAFERKKASGKELTAAMTFPVARMTSGSAIGSLPAASTPTATSR